MSSRLSELVSGKVAVVTGAARGQGRSHALRLAAEGADIIAMDICRQIDSVPYPLASPQDLKETADEVRRLGRRIVTSETDVRDGTAVTCAIDEGVSILGRLDIVVANAGIVSFRAAEKVSESAWHETIDSNLTGVWHTCRAALPHIIEGKRGGSMVLISSSAAHVGLANLSAYSASKGGIVGLMRSLAAELGPHSIRVNTIHPSSVATPMAHNEATYKLFRGRSRSADSSERELTREELEDAYRPLNSLPIPWLEPVDISNAVLFLVSEFGRYVTGSQLGVDAGSANK